LYFIDPWPSISEAGNDEEDHRMRFIDLELRGDHIALDALLKATGLAASGGEAKTAIAAGKVEVDGRVELRRGRKVHADEVVGVHGARVRVHAARAAVPSAPDDAGP
jgi:ribosome-associated protein